VVIQRRSQPGGRDESLQRVDLWRHAGVRLAAITARIRIVHAGFIHVAVDPIVAGAAACEHDALPGSELSYVHHVGCLGKESLGEQGDHLSVTMPAIVFERAIYHVGFRRLNRQDIVQKANDFLPRPIEMLFIPAIPSNFLDVDHKRGRPLIGQPLIDYLKIYSPR